MTILIVDDEQEIREQMARMLSSQFQVEPHPHATASGALSAASTIRFDAAFLDIDMPGTSGLVLAERLKWMQPWLHIVFVTAYNDYATEAFSLEASDYLLKPVRPERLRRLLERLGAGKIPDRKNRITIRLFDRFDILCDGVPLRFARAKSRELMALLILRKGRCLGKYAACELLWPDATPRSSLANLQTAVSSLRKTLDAVPQQTLRVTYLQDGYRLDMNDALIDTDSFRSLCERYRQTGDREAAHMALSAYGTGLLAEETWSWALDEADRLAALRAELPGGIA